MSRLEMLNDDQRKAVDKIVEFLKGPDQFYLLEGPAGTGKTFTARAVADVFKGRFVFTAPTNKATKVLRDALTDKEYKPEARTIYSLLGLSLQPNGEVKELTVPEDPVDLTHYRAVWIDEAGMLNSTVWGHVKTASSTTGVKIILMGDAAQLPPVGEVKSPIWALRGSENYSILQKVMRHNNQILAFATELRQVVDHAFPKVKIQSAFAEGQGVWAMNATEFQKRIIDEAVVGGFSRPGEAKYIAWRNVVVDRWNNLIRRTIFADHHLPRWVVGDRVIFTAPAKNLDDEVIATTDDEGEVEKVIEDWHPVYGEFKCWRVTIQLDDNRLVSAWALHEEHEGAFNRKVEELAQRARQDRRQWRHFWDLKDAFHSLRHAYAITAHRSQGSTYMRCFVDWRDILTNPTKHEAYRCLYVACTRAKKELYLG